MTESSTLTSDMNDVFLLGHKVCSWEEAPLTSDRENALKSMVNQALHLANGIQKAWSAVTAEGGIWEANNFTRQVETIDILAVNSVFMLKRTQEILELTRSRNPDWTPPRESADLATRLQHAEELAAKVRDTINWLKQPRPPASDERIARSRESIARGEGEEISEIIARLQSGGHLVQE